MDLEQGMLRDSSEILSDFEDIGIDSGLSLVLPSTVGCDMSRIRCALG